jgi:hypothetical protein
MSSGQFFLEFELGSERLRSIQHDMGAEKQNDYGTLTPLEVAQNCMVQEQKKEKRGDFV